MSHRFTPVPSSELDVKSTSIEVQIYPPYRSFRMWKEITQGVPASLQVCHFMGCWSSIVTPPTHVKAGPGPSGNSFKQRIRRANLHQTSR